MLSVATNACHPVEPMRGRAPSKVLVALLRACALLFALGILVAVADAAARAPVADGAPGVAAELIEDEPPDLLPTLLIADRAGDALLRRDAGAPAARRPLGLQVDAAARAPAARTLATTTLPPGRAPHRSRPLVVCARLACAFAPFSKGVLMETVGSPAAWLGFTALVVTLLVLDLAVFHRKAHQVCVREALAWTVVWIALAMAFGAGIWGWYGPDRALEFYTGYVIEKALSVDNLFVFLVVFQAFDVPPAYQHRVLFWGILGAMVLRAVFIIAGAALLQEFSWVLYVFGAFLLFTGVKLLLHRGAEPDPTGNPLFRWFQRVVPSVPDYRGAAFTVIENGRRFATPLLLVLVVIEASDVVFAIDSVPAIFGVTNDPFIVYTSNIFAILGLRALYFVLAGAMERFHYLKVGLALVLVFIGGKMLGSAVYHLPVAASLAIILTLLTGSVVASLVRPRASAP